MGVGRETIKEVERLTIQALVQNGMQRCSPGIALRRLPGGCTGFVGLNKATRKTGGALEIGPVIGVRHEEMERMVAQFSGIEFHDCSPFPIAESIGYLMPKRAYFAWTFSTDAAQNHDTVAMMVEAIVRYGFPYMDTYGSLRAIVDVLQSPHKVNSPVKTTRLPIGLYLLGEKDAADSALDLEVTKIGARTDEEAVRFRRLNGELRTLLKS